MSEEQTNAIMSVTIPIIIASFIIIFITTEMREPNSLRALIGGYSGLLFGIVFIIMLVIQQQLNEPQTIMTFVLRIIPFIFITLIISFVIFLLSTYFDIISKGNASSYYYSFSLLSSIFLATQIYILIKPIISDKSGNINLSLSTTKQALLHLFGVINFLMVGILGIVLHFYSTQG